MAHRSKNNSRRHPSTIDDDDYVYPTKKVRETKTRNRRSDKNLIKAGLAEYQNRQENLPEDEWYDDSPMEKSDEDQVLMDDYYDHLDQINSIVEYAIDEDDPDDGFKDDFPDHPDHPDDDIYAEAVNDIYGSWREDY